MNEITLLHCSAFLSYFVLAVYVLVLDIRSILNRVCGYLFFCFSLWSFGLIFFHNTDVSKETAMLWLSINSFGWIPIYTIYLYFMLLFTEQKRVLRSWAFYSLLIPVPLILIYKQWTGDFVTDLVMEWYGWRYVMAATIWPYFHYAYSFFLLIVALVLNYRYVKTTVNLRKKKCGKIIFVTAVIPLVLGVIIDVILPEFEIFLILGMDDLFLGIWAAGLIYTMVKYNFLTVSPMTAAENIMNILPDCLILVNPDETIVRINRHSESVLGYREFELLGKPLDILIPDHPKNESVRHKLSGGDFFSGREIVMQTKDGAIVPMNLSRSLLFDRNGELYGGVFVATDLTWQKRKDMELRESEIRSRSFFNSSITLVYICDLEGNFLDANDVALQCFGYTREEIPGLNFRALLDESDVAPAYGQLQEIRKKGVLTSYKEFRLKRKDGSFIYIETEGTLIKHENGPTTVIGIGKDITERKYAEEALRKSEEGLRVRNEMIEKDLATSFMIQNLLVTTKLPESEELIIEYRYIPMDVIGGDFFSFTPLHDNGLGVFIGDVSNHGVTAALFISLIKATTERIFRNFARKPLEYIETLNYELLDNMPMSFLTAIYGYFEKQVTDGEMTILFRFSNAGHPAPILWRCKTGEVTEPPCRGKLLGMLDNINNDQTEVVLEKGDRIFLYTDGIPEAINGKNEIFGFDRLPDLLREKNYSSLELTLNSVMIELNKFKENSPFNDDIIIIGIEVR